VVTGSRDFFGVARDTARMNVLSQRWETEDAHVGEDLQLEPHSFVSPKSPARLVAARGRTGSRSACCRAPPPAARDDLPLPASVMSEAEDPRFSVEDLRAPRHPHLENRRPPFP